MYMTATFLSLFFFILFFQMTHETTLEESSEDVPLLENVNEAAADEDAEREDTQRKVIRMLNADGTIFEMEDNIVLPDTCHEEDSDEELLNINVRNNLDLYPCHILVHFAVPLLDKNEAAN